MSAFAQPYKTFPPDFQDDTDFVNAALAAYLAETGLPAGMHFEELPTADQKQVIKDAQELKAEARQ
jgi:hypothetical protein